MQELNYKYRGARALVIMQGENLNSFFQTWQEAKKKNIQLPVTEDPDYGSLEKLLSHVLRSSGGYIKWICYNLNKQIPEINQVPEPNEIENKAKDYINHLISIWNIPLVEVPELEFEKVFVSNWGIEYSIDAMMEHAVMHPARHKFQLEELILQQVKGDD